MNAPQSDMRPVAVFNRPDPRRVTARLREWLDELERLLAGLNIGPDDGAIDPDTRAFCIASLRRICDEDLLARKIADELDSRGAPWAPVGTILVVVSENDVFGTVLAYVGARVTGNRVRVKARHTRALVDSLAGALEPALAVHGYGGCEVLDWDSAAQDDDAVLADIDAILIAGGDAVIRHYRRVAPAHVRLIEWGPKLSAAAIGRDADIGDGAALDRLIADVTLFGQRVCSAPQMILVDGARADALEAALIERLPSLPALSDDDRLAQYARGQELMLRGRLDSCVRAAVDRDTGWGVSRSERLDPALWLHRGFQLVVGDVPALLAEVSRRFRRRLQTLGTWGVPAEVALGEPARVSGGERIDANKMYQPNSISTPLGFTRVCAIGAMHARSPLEPHDGAFEFPALVDFLGS